MQFLIEQEQMNLLPTKRICTLRCHIIVNTNVWVKLNLKPTKVTEMKKGNIRY